MLSKYKGEQGRLNSSRNANNNNNINSKQDISNLKQSIKMIIASKANNSESRLNDLTMDRTTSTAANSTFYEPDNISIAKSYRSAAAAPNEHQ